MTNKPKFKKLIVGVLMGGPSEEHEVSLNTGQNVLENLDKTKYEPVAIKISKTGKWFLNGKLVSQSDALKGHDVVFNALHGTFGEDGKAKAVLEHAGIKYTGSGIAGSALAMDKYHSREIFKLAGLNTPKTMKLKRGENYTARLNFFINKIAKLPVVIKPCSNGSSVGVQIVDDLNKLEQISLEQKQRLFFNFNYRFSKTSEIIKDALNSHAMGKILFINIVSNHGLAFKKEYASSWRSDGDKNLHNILETVSIHHLDLMNYHFGKLKNFVYYPSLQSKSGTSFDTCHLVLCYENDVSVSILNSYATPLIDDLSIIGTNGYLHIRSNNLEIYSPRDSFNSDGLFVTPPLHHKSSFSISPILFLKRTLNN